MQTPWQQQDLLFLPDDLRLFKAILSKKTIIKNVQATKIDETYYGRKVFEFSKTDCLKMNIIASICLLKP